MVLVNLTDEQVAALTNQPGILEKLFANPIVFVLLLVGFAVVLYFFFKKNPAADPSTKPMHGREVRRDIMKDEYKKRLETFGAKTKCDLEKGVTKIGIVDSIEYDKELFTKDIINPRTRRKETVPDFWGRVDRIRFRKSGLFAWLKSLVGFGYQYLIVTPETYKIYRDKKRTIVSLDPNVHLINDSDVWTLADQRIVDANRELVLKAQHENIHGSDIDFLRRLAVHSPMIAGALERQSHEANLKEQERKNRISPYT